MEALILLYDKVWRITGKFDSCPEVYQNTLRSDYISLITGLAGDQAKLVRDMACMARYTERADVLRDKLTRIANRQKFYYLVKDLVQTEPLMGLKHEEGGGRNRWYYGLNSSGDDGVRVEKVIQHYKENYKIGAWRKHTFSLPPDSKRLLVGWAVIANWTDGTCGWWKKMSDQMLLRHGAQVHVNSLRSRGFSWTVEFSYVNAADYQFE